MQSVSCRGATEVALGPGAILRERAVARQPAQLEAHKLEIIPSLPRRLHALHELKLQLISRIEFICSRLRFFAHVSGVIGCIFTVFSERHLFISSSIFTEWSLTRRVSNARH